VSLGGDPLLKRGGRPEGRHSMRRRSRPAGQNQQRAELFVARHRGSL